MGCATDDIIPRYVLDEAILSGAAAADQWLDDPDRFEERWAVEWQISDAVREPIYEFCGRLALEFAYDADRDDMPPRHEVGASFAQALREHADSDRFRRVFLGLGVDIDDILLRAAKAAQTVVTAELDHALAAREEVLERLHKCLGRAVGDRVGGLIAERDTIDEPFARALARATEPCAGPADLFISDAVPVPPGLESPPKPRHFRRICRFRVSADNVIDCKVTVWMNDDHEGDVGAKWGHPEPRMPSGCRNVDARTLRGLKLVAPSQADPSLADAARRLLADVGSAWDDYRTAIAKASCSLSRAALEAGDRLAVVHAAIMQAASPSG